MKVRDCILTHESGTFCFAWIERRGAVYFCVSQNPSIVGQGDSIIAALHDAETQFRVIVDEAIEFRNKR